jgi:Gpi18-like mannosyltransferase
VLRLTIAYVLFPSSGFSSDIGTFTAWALTLAEHGPGAFYSTTSFADYPPGYLYVLWLVGGLGHLLAPLANGSAVAATGALIKLPPMVIDIVVGYVLYRVVRGWAAARPDAERLALLAAGLYVFNPVTWYDSALWGQTDASGALVVLLTVAALVRGNSEGAAALTVLAALVKPQFGIVLAPITGAVLLHRHLLAPGAGPRHVPRVPAALRGWFEQERGFWRLLSSAAVALFVLLAGLAPFGLDIFGYLELMARTAGGYPFLSVNAYNIWALTGSDGNQGIANGGAWSWNPDTVPLFGPLPGVAVGAVLLVAALGLVLLRLAWREDRRSILIGATVAAIAFFLLPTRAHERYLFPAFALLPLLAVIDRRWLWATVALSVASFINLHMVLTNPLYATPNVANLPLGELFRQQPAAYLSVLLHVGVFAFAAWQLRPSAADVTVSEGQPSPDAGFAAAEAAAAAPAVATFAGNAPAVALPEPAPPGRWSVAGAQAMVGRLLAVVPTRRDRSAQLAGERGGRIDRLDVAALLLVFVATLGLRTLNLGQPYGMHFDEVYHARTGTEFLQHWRYGIQHSIYEWTHPHLAKYVMALGIDWLGNNRVVATRELGAPVRAAALERRWDERGGPRTGERAYVATANDVMVVDLATDERVATLALSVEALAVNEDSHTLYLADAGGGIWQLPTTALDVLRDYPTSTPPQPQQLAALQLPGRPTWLGVAGSQLIVRAEGDVLVSLDVLTGQPTGQVTLAGVSEAVPINTDAGDGLAVGTQDGILLLDRLTLEETERFVTDAPVTGLALVTEGADKPTVYAAIGDALRLLRVPTGETPSLADRVVMPNRVWDVIANPATALVHVLGASPDGSGSSLYVIQPSNPPSVFADAVLPFAPQALLMDVQPRRPADDRLDALAFSATGGIATVDVGSNSFAWRFPGVLAGALMAVCIYLLARFLFRRRSVAVLAALLVLADGMMFANARIAMNDTYVALFIVAALTLFAPLYVGRWRSPLAVAAGVLGVAVLLGLALASKWVGAYGLGAVVLLILLRSALGRLVALAGMLALTALLGYIAIAPSPNATQLNFLFLGVMVGLTTALAIGITVRPIHMSRDELRLAIAGPAIASVLALAAAVAVAVRGGIVEGSLLTPGRLALAGVVLLLLAGAGYMVARAAGRRGWGPLAEHEPSPMAELTAAEQPVVELMAELTAAEQPVAAQPVEPTTAEPPASAWLRPGGGLLGLPWLATLATLVAIPLLIYVISFVPWVALNNRWTDDNPQGHTGQTVIELQKSMYDYHNNLRATHAASSPWWAWPLDMKPVWFYQRDFAGGTLGVIYDTGNLVLFWLAIPAVGFAAWQAWRRRSPSLALLIVAVLGLWLPWARIDRATFQYHIFTTLPFAFLCLAYFLAELWHGPSRRTWQLARVAAALAIVGPALLWLLRLPLCAVARVGQVHPESEVCKIALSRSIALSDLQLVGVLAVVVGVGAFVLLAWLGDDVPAPVAERRGLLLPGSLGLAAIGALIGLGAAFLPGPRAFLLPLDATIVALVGLLLLAVPAYYVLRAADARRFVVGVLVAAVGWFVLWYPNISGLPVPTPLAQVHLITLPTYNYSFQFSVNQDAPGSGFDVLGPLILLAVLTTFVLSAIYAVRAWRAARSEGGLITTPHEAG